MSFYMMPTVGIGGAVSEAAAAYLVSQSLLFDGSSYMSRTPGSAGNRKTVSGSFWTKLGTNTSNPAWIAQGVDNDNQTRVQLNGNTILAIQHFDSAGITFQVLSNAVLRDPSGWYHIAWYIDTTQATDTNRIKAWINGVAVTWGTTSWPSLNFDTDFNSTDPIHIGSRPNAGGNYFSGLIALPILVDGAALDYTSFAEIDAENYINPIEYTGTDTTSTADIAVSYLAGSDTAGTATSLTQSSVTMSAGLIVVSLTTNALASNFTSVTVDGNTATQIASYQGTNNGCAVYAYYLASGTTGDVVVNQTSQATGMAVYHLSNITSAEAYTVGDDNSDPMTTDVFCPEGSAVIACAAAYNPNSFTWSGVTEDIDHGELSGGEDHGSHASAAISSTQTLTVTADPDTAVSERSMLAVVFKADTTTIGYGTNGGAYDFADSSWFGLNVAGNDDQTALVTDAPGSTEWHNITGAWTMGAGSASRDSTVNAIRSHAVFTDDFSLTMSVTGTTGLRLGVYAANEDGTFNSTDAAGGMASMTNSYYANFGGGLFYRGSGSTVGVSQTDGAVTISRTSGAITINTAGGNHTFAVSYSGPMRLAISGGGVAIGATSILFTSDGQAGNSFFDTGFATTDQVADTPTDDATLGIGNFNAINPNNAKSTVGTLSEANTKYVTGADYSGIHFQWSLPAEGKWGWKITAGTLNDTCRVGVCSWLSAAEWTSNAFDATNVPSSFDALIHLDTSPSGSGNGLKRHFSGGSLTSVDTSATAKTWTTGEVVEFLLDQDNNTLDIKIDGTSLTQVTGIPSVPLMPFLAGYTDTFNVDCGQFGYVPSETGFKALGTQNLPAPTISDPSEHFQTVLYTGNGTAIGSGGNAITGVGFQPDFVWIKGRDSAYYHRLQDAVRAATKEMYSNDTSAEATDTETLASFDADGFTVGSATGYNSNTEDFVAWCWKANGAGSSNTDGSITSTVSANPTAGFSIVSYTGTNAIATVGHGLTSAPNMIIAKNRDSATAWHVYHSSNTSEPETDYLLLNTTAATADGVSVWNDTAPTTSVFSLGANGGVNGSSTEQIAYCWAEVEGFSKFGSYEGTNSTSGPFIYLGFKPAFLLIKEIDSATHNWNMFDGTRNPFNLTDKELSANDSGAEATYTNAVDFLSNGFTIVGNPSEINGTGTHIYAAFAEVPFQGGASAITQGRAR